MSPELKISLNSIHRREIRNISCLEALIYASQVIFFYFHFSFQYKNNLAYVQMLGVVSLVNFATNFNHISH